MQCVQQQEVQSSTYAWHELQIKWCSLVELDHTFYIMEIQEGEKCTLLPIPISSEKCSSQRWNFLRRMRNPQLYQVERSEENKDECTYRLLPSSDAEAQGKEFCTSVDIAKRVSCEEISEQIECGESESSDRRESTSVIGNKTEQSSSRDLNQSHEDNLNDEDNSEHAFSSSQDSVLSDNNGSQKGQSSDRHSKVLEMPRNTSEYLTERKNIQAKRLANHFLCNSDDENITEKRPVRPEENSETLGSLACAQITEISSNTSKHEPNVESDQCDENFRSSKSDKNSEVLSDPDSHKLTLFSSTKFKKNFNPFAKFFNTTSKSTEMLVPDESTSRSEPGSERRKSFYRVNDAIGMSSQDSISIQTYKKIANDFEDDLPLVSYNDSTKDEDKHSVPLFSEKSLHNQL